MLTMDETEERIRQEMEDIAKIRKDVEWIHRDLVSRHYPVALEGDLYGFDPTCHAYVMLVFAWIDRLSKFWAGGKNNIAPHTPRRPHTGQTERMVAFMEKYHSPQRTVHQLAVELWRHTLMHEGKPRELVNKNGEHFHWTLVWQLEDAQSHYTVETRPPAPHGEAFTLHTFRMDVLHLVDDLEHIFGGYCSDLRAPENAPLRQTFAARERELAKKIGLWSPPPA